LDDNWSDWSAGAWAYAYGCRSDVNGLRSVDGIGGVIVRLIANRWSKTNGEARTAALAMVSVVVVSMSGFNLRARKEDSTGN
jgi:hypothetical protein